MLRVPFSSLLVLAIGFLLVACGNDAPAFTESPTVTAVPAAVVATPPAATAEPTEAPTPTREPTPTAEPTPTPAPTHTPAPTRSPTATPAPNPLAELDLGPLLEEERPEAAKLVRALPWVADGVDSVEIADLDPLLNLALKHPELFGNLIDQPWVLDGVAYPDSEIIRYLDSIAGVSPENARLILEHGLLAPPDEGRLTVAKTLQKLSGEHPDVVNELLAQPSGRQIVFELLRLPWVSDIAINEEAGINSLLDVAESEFSLLSGLLQKAWVRDGISYQDMRILDEVGDMAKMSPEGAAALIELDIADYENTDRLKHVTGLSVIAQNYAGEFDDLLHELWPHRRSEIKLLAKLARRYKDLFAQAIDPEIEGGYSLEEMVQLAQAIDRIRSTLYRAFGAKWRAELQFLDTPDPWDSVALESMRRMLRNGHLAEVMAHPAMQDGITDQEAKVVATLRSVMEHRPSLLKPMLDPTKLKVNERVIDLTLAGSTTLAVMHHQPIPAETMDFLEYAVTNPERFMGAPFPQNYVALYIGYAHYHKVSGGFYGTHMVLNPKYIGSNFAAIIAHETGHYYWTGPEPSWITEGAAELLRDISEYERDGIPIEPHHRECTLFDNIGELNASLPKAGTEGYRCNYRLGQRFWLDLYQTLGEDIFRMGFRQVYLEQSSDMRGISDAFKKITPNNNHLIEQVVYRHYGSSPGQSTSVLDVSKPDPTLFGINGRIDSVHVGSLSGAERSTISLTTAPAELALHLAFSRASTGLFELPLTVAEYFEDGSIISQQTVVLDSYDRGEESAPIQIASSRSPGKYFLFIYDGIRKVAEAEYEIHP